MKTKALFSVRNYNFYADGSAYNRSARYRFWWSVRDGIVWKRDTCVPLTEEVQSAYQAYLSRLVLE